MILNNKFLGGMKMNSYILQGEYAEIITALLSEQYKIDSLIKLVFMSFCIRNESKTSYGRRKMDLTESFFSNLKLKLFSHPEELVAILEVIEKLKDSGWISISGDEITVNVLMDSFVCENVFLNNCKNKRINPINEINKLDSQAFTEEVLRHV